MGDMRVLIIAVCLFSLLIKGTAQTKKVTNMKKEEKTIRLIYPQWQGGYIAAFIPEIKDSTAASQGYALGAQLLNFLAPTSMDTYTVPVSMSPTRKVQDGVYDRDVIVEQTRAALNILKKANPDCIVTLGGECSVSVPPFTYLADKYDGDVAMIWIDAHPDITLPGEAYPGFHAMAVTACLGLGDKKIINELPKKISADKVLFVGLRDWERDEIKERQKQLGIKHLTVEELKDNSNALMAWVKSTGVKHILVHFDMDVLEPTEIISAVGIVKNGMRINEVVRIINDIAQNHHIVGLTIAEAMPRTAILIRDMLSRLPMIGQ